MHIVTPLNLSNESVSNFIENDLVSKMKLSDHCFITDHFLLKKLFKMNLPIVNNKIGALKILQFLSFLDSELNKNEYETIIEIPFVTFEDYFPRNQVTKYKKILNDLKIMVTVPYEDGTFYKRPNSTNDESGKCMRYRIYNNYLQPKHLSIVSFMPTRKKRILPDLKNEIEGLNEKYIKTIENLKIDLHAAINAEFAFFKESHKNPFRLKARISILLRTENDRFIRYGEKVDRIYHTFSNVPSISRKFFNIPFHNIDVKNCQPLLLVSYLAKNSMLFDQNYKKDCELALLYNHFTGIDGLNRDAAKIRLYRSVFFGFDKRTKFNKKFKELYPLTWQSLLDLKKNEISLAAQLQNLESSLFNFIVPAKSKYYMTLFDAIYFTDMEDLNDITLCIKTFFNNVGVKVALRINDKELQ